MAERTMETALVYTGDQSLLIGLGRLGRLDIIKRSSYEIEPRDYNETERGKIFCDCCTGNLSRKSGKNSSSPNKLIRNGIEPHFSHYPKTAHVPCRYRTKPTDGKNFLKEEVTNQFVDHESLVVCNKWSHIQNPEFEELEGPRYTGPRHDPWGEDVNQALARHYGPRVGIPYRISSVKTVIRNIKDMIYMAVSFPDDIGARVVKDIMKSLNKFKDGEGIPYLLYGRIESYVAKYNFNDGEYTRTSRTFLNIEDGFGNFYVNSDVADARNFSEKSQGRLVLGYGILRSGGIYIDHLGQIDLIPEDLERYFPL